MRYYFYSDGTGQRGPFSFNQLKDENIKKETLVWYEGLEDWKPAKEIEEIEEIFQLSPPPIPTIEIESTSENDNSKEKVDDSVSDIETSEPRAPRKKSIFLNPFSFNGRIRRIEYGLSLIIYFVIAPIIGTIADSGSHKNFLSILFIPMLWFLLAQGSKRCHDIGNTGWFQIIPFYVFWMIFAKGESGVFNNYGVNPK